MVSLMQRRREMMAQADAPASYWDYEWDYTMGKLEEQPGLSVDKSGTGSSSLISDGEKITTNSSAYFQPYFTSSGIHSNLRTMPDGYGTIEVVCYGVWNNSTSGTRNNLRVTASQSSTNRITIFVFNGKWRLLKHSTTTHASNVAIADAANNTEYTIRIVMKGSAHDIYINGDKVQSDIVGTGFAAGGSNSIMHQNGGGSSYYAVIKSLKIHLGPD